jgi:DNA-binding NtrC family response regulator
MKLLWIDDEPAFLKSIEDSLQAAGHASDIFTDPHVGISACQQNDYDVVITDYNMPGMNGLEVLQAIQVFRPGLPVILATGNTDQDIRQEAERQGVSTIMNKPLNLMDLLKTLTRIEDGVR